MICTLHAAGTGTATVVYKDMYAWHAAAARAHVHVQLHVRLQAAAAGAAQAAGSEPIQCVHAEFCGVPGIMSYLTK